MKLSIVIPAFNEEKSISNIITQLVNKLSETNINYEIIVINDSSSDGTINVLKSLIKKYPQLNFITNTGPNGFGHAVRYGLEKYKGDCVAIMMADSSDSPSDLVKYYETMISGNYDCVFGNRFENRDSVKGYPLTKYILNRTANNVIRLTMGIKYGDSTNAFKLYKREVIESLKPFLSPSFSLTIELPLKAITRGYSYAIIPNTWHQRKYGKSKLKIRKVFGDYLLILIYCFIERKFDKKPVIRKISR